MNDTVTPQKPAPLGVPAPGNTHGRNAPTYLVPFYVGDGRGPIFLTVTYVAEYLRGPDGLCAFCHGDPLAEESGPETLIGNFWARNPHQETCPCCSGRPA